MRVLREKLAQLGRNKYSVFPTITVPSMFSSSPQNNGYEDVRIFWLEFNTNFESLFCKFQNQTLDTSVY